MERFIRNWFFGIAIGFVSGIFILNYIISPLPECYGPMPLEKTITINGTKYVKDKPND